MSLEPTRSVKQVEIFNVRAFLQYDNVSEGKQVKLRKSDERKNA